MTGHFKLLRAIFRGGEMAHRLIWGLFLPDRAGISESTLQESACTSTTPGVLSGCSVASSIASGRESSGEMSRCRGPATTSCIRCRK